jgi:hypothetical protein
MFDQVKPKQTKLIFELDSKVLGWFDHGQTKPKFFFWVQLDQVKPNPRAYFWVRFKDVGSV